MIRFVFSRSANCRYIYTNPLIIMKYFALLAILSIPFISFAQSFDSPESVEYDVVNSRWLVGNHGSGEVLEYSPGSGTLTPFCSGMTTGPYGIEILGNVLY